MIGMVEKYDRRKRRAQQEYRLARSLIKELINHANYLMDYNRGMAQRVLQFAKSLIKYYQRRIEQGYIEEDSL
jgi:hypothetical protein